METCKTRFMPLGKAQRRFIEKLMFKRPLLKTAKYVVKDLNPLNNTSQLSFYSDKPQLDTVRDGKTLYGLSDFISFVPLDKNKSLFSYFIIYKLEN